MSAPFHAIEITSTRVLQILSRHVGAGNGVSARAIVLEITRLAVSEEGAERRLRKVITDLRLQGNHVCAHPSHGYFLAANAEELNRTCAFLYDRAMASAADGWHSPCCRAGCR